MPGHSTGASPLLVIAIVALGLVFILFATFLGLFSNSRSAPLAKASGSIGFVAADCLSPTFSQTKIKDQVKFAAAIKQYIGQSAANSPFIKPADLSANFISGAVASGVNPAYLVNIARKESNFATARNSVAVNHPEAHNAFGRTATASQPHVQGSNRLWYKYDSYAASLPDQSAYLKRQYFDEGLVTYEAIITKYAPPGDSNDTAAYIIQMQEWVAKLIQSAGDGLDCAPKPVTAVPAAPAPPSPTPPPPRTP